MPPTGAPSNPTEALIASSKASREKQVQTLLEEQGYSSPADPVEMTDVPPPTTDPRDRLVADDGGVKLATPHPAFDARSSPTRSRPAPGVETAARQVAGDPAKVASSHAVFDK